uniref:Uncharacterized protein n=1 Tax=Physcomitrium patens TaxID=3218 RepID=A0A2K1K0C0_PHYPA|nr:hypothetical protein PHYPA_014337 [Physcomitrium patens]
MKTNALYRVGNHNMKLHFSMQEFVDKHFKKYVPNIKGIEYMEGRHFI